MMKPSPGLSSRIVFVLTSSLLALSVNMSVAEYLNRFTYLSRHAPEVVNTNGKKQYRFLNGLHNQIQVHLLNTDYPSFKKLVDKAIIIEAKQAKIERGGKRKQQLTGHSPILTPGLSDAATESILMQPQHYQASHATTASSVLDAEA
jgi:hypothetical protein